METPELGVAGFERAMVVCFFFGAAAHGTCFLAPLLLTW